MLTWESMKNLPSKISIAGWIMKLNLCDTSIKREIGTWKTTGHSENNQTVWMNITNEDAQILKSLYPFKLMLQMKDDNNNQKMVTFSTRRINSYNISFKGDPDFYDDYIYVVFFENNNRLEINTFSNTSIVEGSPIYLIGGVNSLLSHLYQCFDSLFRKWVRV